jgi:mono/diheme cytochrome c family protein
VRRDVRSGVVALLLALAASGCTRIEYALNRVSFFAYMRDAPFFDPYEAPRPAPPFAVAFESPAGETPPPITPTEAGLNAFAAGPHGTNPFPADSAFLDLGRVMFERHCSVCHGPLGRGDGSIIGPDKYPPLAPNLTLPPTVARTDGYLYGMIAVARGSIMPAYGSRTSHRERWAIVSYVRQLQAAAGQGGGD